MAKQKIDLPSIEQSAPSELPQTAYVNYSVEPEDILAIEKAKMNETTGYISRHIDVKMNRDQASKFKLLMRKLEDENKQLKDGTPVNNKRRAVLWLIENH